MSNNDKIREAFERDFPLPLGIEWTGRGYSPRFREDGLCRLTDKYESMLAAYQAALTQKPESERIGTVVSSFGPDSRGLYRICVYSGSPARAGQVVYSFPQPSPQVPEGCHHWWEDITGWGNCKCYKCGAERMGSPGVLNATSSMAKKPEPISCEEQPPVKGE